MGGLLPLVYILWIYLLIILWLAAFQLNISWNFVLFLFSLLVLYWLNLKLLAKVLDVLLDVDELGVNSALIGRQITLHFALNDLQLGKNTFKLEIIDPRLVVLTLTTNLVVMLVLLHEVKGRLWFPEVKVAFLLKLVGIRKHHALELSEYFFLLVFS